MLRCDAFTIEGVPFSSTRYSLSAILKFYYISSMIMWERTEIDSVWSMMGHDFFFFRRSFSVD